MHEQYSIPLSMLIKEFKLETLYLPGEPEELMISSPEVHRPGLALTGFFKVFDHNRVQILGSAEYTYLCEQPESVRDHKIEEFFSHCPAAVVLSGGFEGFPTMKEAAERHGVPLFRSKETTSPFMAALIAFLNVQLAPRITRHGVLVEVYGEGLLLLGDSGVGKSETAIELIKRGHRLIADDAVEISRVSDITLVGRAPEIIRHYMELRGIGIIDIRRIYGTGAVKESEKIQVIVKLEHWVQGKMYDRMGLENEYEEILGIKIPSITIPVRPGRNLAVILEIAAMNFRLKKMGYNTAEEFSRRLEEEFKPR
jgi:HPr kinase/phosphorylase